MEREGPDLNPWEAPASQLGPPAQGMGWTEWKVLSIAVTFVVADIAAAILAGLRPTETWASIPLFVLVGLFFLFAAGTILVAWFRLIKLIVQGIGRVLAVLRSR